MSSKGMNIYDKRLASFRPKRRPSSALGSKLVATKWPHEQPSPRKLAEAGFYFNPTEFHPDNVTCYLCDKDLDGWEPEDNPSIEHLKHCPDCGWARVAATQAIEDDRKHPEDPRGSIMVEARLMTFGRKWWPHEDKKGWLPKMERMAEAGWHYAPSKDSNDFAICAYCELSLDGWEATDSPLEEHQRRSPSCLFFNWKPPKRPTKKTRASVAGSVSSLHGDDPETVVPAKKASRGKKAKKPEPALDEPVEPARGQKRPSNAAYGPIIIYDGSKDTDSETESQPPPTKKRATRASLAAEQARDYNVDQKPNDDSDGAASIISHTSTTMSKIAVKPTKKRPGRRPSKVRAPSKSRGNSRKPKDAPSDDELDRILAVDLDRPLTDEEEGFKDFKKPFIRPAAKRLTRSRASLAVEESARDAPDGVLIHASASARSRTPAATPGRAKHFNFFREGSQDLAMQVRVPKDLAQSEEVEVSVKSREKLPVENAIFARKSSPERVELDEPKVKKAAGVKKAQRGRKKVSEATTVAEDEPEPPKPKRGRLVKKADMERRKSDDAVEEGHTSKMPPQRFSGVEIMPHEPTLAVQYERHSPPAVQKPGRSKGKSTKDLSRGSAISVASTAAPVPDASEDAAEPEPEEPRQSFMDVDPTPAEVSDAGSVIRYDVDVTRPVLAATSDAEPEAQKEPTPKPKRGKKTSGASKAKKSTRSSALSQATALSMSTDGATSVINSGDESDISRASRTGGIRKGRKVVKKGSKKTLVAQRSREDILKKASESFFSSSQGEEMVNRGKKPSGSFAEKISPAPDAHIVETTPQGRRVISLTNTTYPHLPAEEPESATDVDEAANADRAATPVNIPASPARRPPLSPVRTAANIPLASTPKSSKPGRAASTRPWTAMDLEAVLAGMSTTDHVEEEEEEVLNSREMEMTVEEWVKFSAAGAEFRMTSEAERLIAVFEKEGKRAIECVEGLVTVD